MKNFISKIKNIESKYTHMLEGVRLNKINVLKILDKVKPELVLFNGHGSEVSIHGNNDEVIMDISNAKSLNEKIVHALSCRAGKELGSKAIEAGAHSFMGYDDDFIFWNDENYAGTPLKDPLVKPFFSPTLRLIASLIKGNTVREALRKSQEEYIHQIEKLSTSESGENNAHIIGDLWTDQQHQVAHGNLDINF